MNNFGFFYKQHRDQATKFAFFLKLNFCIY